MEKISLRITNYALRLVIAAVILFTANTAFAASHVEQVIEGADLTAVKRLAIACPRHYKVPGVSDEPTLETLIEIMGTYDKAQNYQLISYPAIVEAIKKDTGVDITALSYRDSEKAFRDNVGNYADAFVTLTTANNDDPTIFMFEVQNAQTKDVMYLLKLRNAAFGKNSRGYQSACESFYKGFDLSIDKAIKDKKEKK